MDAGQADDAHAIGNTFLSFNQPLVEWLRLNMGSKSALHGTIPRGRSTLATLQDLHEVQCP
jgi:hypothetical protein